MNKKTLKIAILFFLLVLPPLVFVFLKSFGENKYAVESFYQSEIPEEVKTTCNDLKAPHRITLGESEELRLLLAVKDTVVSVKTRNILRRIDARYNEVVGILLFLKYDIPNESFFNQHSFASEVWNDFVSCELITDKEKPKMVLIDQKRVIRGYYDYEDPKEIDRLLLEIEIINRNGNE